jgi:hypothetical protein
VIDPTVQLPIALALSFLLISAARSKLRTPSRFRAVLGAYHLLPAGLLPVAAVALPIAELLTGAALLLAAARPVAGFMAMLLFVLYGLAMGINLLRGRPTIDCGCGDTPQPLSAALLVRNGVLAMASLLVTLPAGVRAQGWLDYLIVAMACGTLMLLYVAFEQLTANASAIRDWRQNS